MTLEYLQNYWWVLISVLGGILVFLLFVQGGQSMIYTFGRKPEQRDVLLQGMGSKWELTYTTLVVFGGAFFASFPPVLLHMLRRRVLALDPHPVQLRASGRQLRIPQEER